MTFGSHIFRGFILFLKSCIGQFLTVLWPVHGLCVWIVCGQFLRNFEAGFLLSLWPIFQLVYGFFVDLC